MGNKRAENCGKKSFISKIFPVFLCLFETRGTRPAAVRLIVINRRTTKEILYKRPKLKSSFFRPLVIIQVTECLMIVVALFENWENARSRVFDLSIFFTRKEQNSLSELHSLGRMTTAIQIKGQFY